MADVFLSYARNDEAHARLLVRELESRGWSVWWDRMLPGHRGYSDVIEEQLDAARSVLVIWSKTAVSSEWVRAEANRAREQKKLVQSRFEGCRLPLPFDQIHCADLSTWNGASDHPGWKSVADGLEETLSGARTTHQARPVRIGGVQVCICVLPLENRNRDEELDYFGDGITEDLITDLSKIRSVSVMARNSAFSARDLGLSVRDLARTYGVTHVLSGSVRRSGNSVRISVQLVDADTEIGVWGERYDRRLSDLFEVQDLITDELIRNLHLQLLPGERVKPRGPTDPEAFELYLRGTRPALSHDKLTERVSLLESAVDRDPSFSDAWGALAKARALVRCQVPWAEKPLHVAGILSAAERTRDLDPSSIGALHARYLLLHPFGQFLEADALVAQMRELGDNDVDSLFYMASHLDSLGRIREAIEVCRTAHTKNPLDAACANLLGRMLYYGGRIDESWEVLTRANERWPDAHPVVMNLVNIAAHRGDWAAIDCYLDAERLERYPLREFERLAKGYASVMRSKAPEVVSKPIAAARRRFERDGTAELYQLQLAAELGFTTEAHDIAVSARLGPQNTPRDVLGYDAYRPHFLFDHLFPAFRQDPRFVGICHRMGLVDYWVRKEIWPDCADENAGIYDFRASCLTAAAAR